MDAPGNFFWEEILEAFPNSKVILSVTEEDSWRINKYKIQILEIQNELELVKFFEFSLMLSSTSRKMYFVSYYYLNAILGTSNTW